MSIFSLRRIADICKNYRTQNNLNQAEMSSLLNMNEQTFGKIEREQYFPKIDQIEQIIAITGASIEQLKSDNSGHLILAALKGKAQNETEKHVFDTLVKAILCLDKHKNIRAGKYSNE